MIQLIFEKIDNPLPLGESVKPSGLPTTMAANKIISKVQPFKITLINPSNLPSDKPPDNIGEKSIKTGHFLPPPSMVSIYTKSVRE